MSTGEAILRSVALVLGAGLAALLILPWVRPSRMEINGEGFGCIAFLLGLLALTLVVGGIAGPEAARAMWN